MTTKEVLLAQPNSRGKIKYIRLELDGDMVCRWWGQKGGSEQYTDNMYDGKNIGRSNELSPEEVASAAFDRIIEKKMKKGYRKVESLDDDVSLDEMSFDDPPTSFNISKPHGEIEPAQLNEMIEDGAAQFQVKENGLGHHIIVNHSRQVDVYTRGMDNHTQKYLKIVAEAEDLVKRGVLLPDSVLCTEFSLQDQSMGHVEAFQIMSSISKANTLKGKCKPDLTKTYERLNEHPIKATVFHIPYFAGVDMTDQTYDETYSEITNSFGTDRVITQPTVIPGMRDHDHAIEFLEENMFNCEGLVAWDLRDKAEVSFNGRPKRACCYKIKLDLDDDVVAFDLTDGGGDLQGKMGALLVGKYLPNGELKPLGRVGTGFGDDDRDLDYWRSRFPCVITIEFKSRFRTGNYQFPVFVREHPDKKPKECEIEDIYRNVGGTITYTGV